MVIGVLTIDVGIPGAFSLKEKRMIVNRIRDRVKHRYNVSIAEVDDNDIWNSACIGIVAVSNDQGHLNEMLSKVVAFIETIRDCHIEDYQMEFI